MTVLLFGAARDLAGRDTLALPDAATVGALRRALAETCPPLAALIQRSQVAIDLRLEPDAFAIPAGAEVALIPPVSGG